MHDPTPTAPLPDRPLNGRPLDPVTERFPIADLSDLAAPAIAAQHDAESAALLAAVERRERIRRIRFVALAAILALVLPNVIVWPCLLYAGWVAALIGLVGYLAVGVGAILAVILSCEPWHAR